MSSESTQSSKSFRLQPTKDDQTVIKYGLIVLILAGCLVSIQPSTGFGWLLFALSICALYGLLFLHLFLHELGHAVAGTLVGMQVLGITIGTGGTLAGFRTPNFFLHIRTFPASGRAYAVHRRERFARIRDLIFSAAGPFVSVMLLLATMQLMNFVDAHPQALLLPTYQATSSLIKFALLIQAGIVLGNLWPRMISIEGNLIPSDGLRMFRALGKKGEDIGESVALYHLLQALQSQRKGEFSEAERRYEEGLAKYPQSQLLSFTKPTFLCGQRRFAEARQIWIDRLASKDLSLGDRIRILDALACMPLYYDCPEHLPEAYEWLKQALALAANEVTLKGTHGSILVELGRYAEGRGLLEEVLKLSPNANDQCIAACYLALAARKEGDLRMARRMFRRAKKINPDCIVLRKISAVVRMEGSQV